MQPLILASASPRRREICDLLGLVYTVCPAVNEPKADVTLAPEDAILQVARAKAQEVAQTHGEAVVLGADTAVVVDNVILGKPHSAEEAKDMLRRLSGRSHCVITGVWVCGEGYNCGFADTAEVSFFEMDEPEIDAYVASGEPMDKAGAYAVQGYGARFIRRVCGDFYTVMGLPCSRLYQLLFKNTAGSVDV